MPTGEHPSCLGHLLRPAAQDLGDDLRRQVGGEAADVECQHYLAAHGVDVAHRVGGGDGTVVVGVIHHGREEVERLDDRHLVVDPVDGGIVAHLQPDEQVGVLFSAEQVL